MQRSHSRHSYSAHKSILVEVKRDLSTGKNENISFLGRNSTTEKAGID